MTNPAAPNTALDVAYLAATRRIALSHNAKRISDKTRNEALIYAYDLFTASVNSDSAIRGLNAIERD